jgi:hypothetical protein
MPETQNTLRRNEGQGANQAPALTETDRNNETINAQTDQRSNHHSGSRGDRDSVHSGDQTPVAELPPTELPLGVNANCPQGQLGEGQLPDSNCPRIAPELPPAEPMQNQQVAAGANEAFFDDELSRFELEFKEKDGETHVKIRERMRFPFGGNRPSWVLGVFRCGRLTPRQLKAVKDKTLPPDVRGAIANGDIAYEILEGIFDRPGKGATAEARAAGTRARSKTQQRGGSGEAQITERSGEGLRDRSGEHRADQGSGDGPGSLDGNFPTTDAVTESREIN